MSNDILIALLENLVSWVSGNLTAVHVVVVGIEACLFKITDVTGGN